MFLGTHSRQWNSLISEPTLGARELSYVSVSATDSVNLCFYPLLPSVFYTVLNQITLIYEGNY